MKTSMLMVLGLLVSAAASASEGRETTGGEFIPQFVKPIVIKPDCAGKAAEATAERTKLSDGLRKRYEAQRRLNRELVGILNEASARLSVRQLNALTNPRATAEYVEAQVAPVMRKYTRVSATLDQGLTVRFLPKDGIALCAEKQLFQALKDDDLVARAEACAARARVGSKDVAAAAQELRTCYLSAREAVIETDAQGEFTPRGLACMKVHPDHGLSFKTLPDYFVDVSRKDGGPISWEKDYPAFEKATFVESEAAYLREHLDGACFAGL